MTNLWNEGALKPISHQDRLLSSVDGDPIAGRDKLAFGDRCTGDYFLQRRSEHRGSKEKNPDESALYPGAKAAVVFFDLWTDWRETLPRCCRSSEETRKSVQHFEGLDEKVKQMYCDGAPELKRAMADVGIKPDFHARLSRYERYR